MWSLEKLVKSVVYALQTTHHVPSASSRIFRSTKNAEEFGDKNGF